MRRRLLLAGALPLPLLAGCALVAVRPEPPVTTSLLDQLPAELPQAPRRAGTLLVFTPEARPAFDTTQMAYALQPHEIAYFARNAWAETPPQMLQPLLVRTLEGTGAFAAVLAPPHVGSVSLGLRTEIVELVQDFGAYPPVLRLALRARLSDEAAHRTLATREWTVREPMPLAGPRGGVLAANAALARVLRQLAAFVLEQAP